MMKHKTRAALLVATICTFVLSLSVGFGVMAFADTPAPAADAPLTVGAMYLWTDLEQLYIKIDGITEEFKQGLSFENTLSTSREQFAEFDDHFFIDGMKISQIYAADYSYTNDNATVNSLDWHWGPAGANSVLAAFRGRMLGLTAKGMTVTIEAGCRWPVYDGSNWKLSENAFAETVTYRYENIGSQVPFTKVENDSVAEIRNGVARIEKNGSNVVFIDFDFGSVGTEGPGTTDNAPVIPYDMTSATCVNFQDNDKDHPVSPEDMAKVMDNILINGRTLAEYNATVDGLNNINVHFGFQDKNRIWLNFNGTSLDLLKTDLTVGLKSDFRPATKLGDGWHVLPYKLGYDVTYTLQGDGTFKETYSTQVKPEYIDITANRVYYYNANIAAIVFSKDLPNMINLENSIAAYPDFFNNILINGRTLTEFNQAHPEYAGVNAVNIHMGNIAANGVYVCHNGSSTAEFKDGYQITLKEGLVLPGTNYRLSKGISYTAHGGTDSYFTDDSVEYTDVAVEDVKWQSSDGINILFNREFSGHNNLEGLVSQYPDFFNNILINDTPLPSVTGFPAKINVHRAHLSKNSVFIWTNDPSWLTNGLRVTIKAGCIIAETNCIVRDTITYTAPSAASSGNLASFIPDRETLRPAKSEYRVCVGEQVQLTYTATPGEVTFTTEDTDKIEVTTDGVVTGLAAGSAIVTGHLGSTTAEFNITVFESYGTPVVISTSGGAGTHYLEIEGEGFSNGKQVTNIENRVNDAALKEFYDHFKVDGLSITEYNAQYSLNINIHCLESKFCVYFYDKQGQMWKIPGGTRITFEAGCILPEVSGTDVACGMYKFAEDYTLVASPNTERGWVPSDKYDPSVTITPVDDIPMYVGDETTVEIEVAFGKDVAENQKELVWELSAEGIITVEEGTIVANEVGEVVVTVKAFDDTEITFTVIVTERGTDSSSTEPSDSSSTGGSSVNPYPDDIEVACSGAVAGVTGMVSAVCLLAFLFSKKRR